MSPGNQKRNPVEPKAHPTTRPSDARQDRTSTVVAVGLAALAVGGVLTVFSAPLLALVAPPTSEEAAAQPPAAGSVEAASTRSAASDGGASGPGTTTTSSSPSTNPQRPDRDGHS